jgi:hypothetical protein
VCVTPGSWAQQSSATGQLLPSARRVIGILAEDTPQRLVVRNENGDETRLKPADIKARRRSQLSMMPEDLVNQMTEGSW